MYLWVVLIIATTCKGDNPNVKNYVASVSQLFKGIPEELITSSFFLRENSCSHYLSALSFFNWQYFFKYFCVSFTYLFPSWDIIQHQCTFTIYHSITEISTFLYISVIIYLRTLSCRAWALTRTPQTTTCLPSLRAAHTIHTGIHSFIYSVVLASYLV